MKKLLVLFSLLLYAGVQTSKAQEYEDLMLLWVDQKYEKLVEKAERYTQRDKTKNHPLPYLYLAKGLYRISLDDKLKTQDRFKRAENEALSYVVKYKKKDKGGTYKADADQFISEMKKTYFEQAENFVEGKDYRKALSIMKKVVVFDPENAGVWLVKGVCEIEMKNKGEGEKNTAKGIEMVKTMQDFNDLLEVDQDFLRFSLIAYTEFLMRNNNRSTAQGVISLGYPYFQKTEDDLGQPIKGNIDYIELYNKVVNG